MAKKTGHSTASQAAKVAAAAGVKQLLLGHFSARYKDYSTHLQEAKAVFEKSVILKEGDIFDIPLRT